MTVDDFLAVLENVPGHLIVKVAGVSIHRAAPSPDGKEVFLFPNEPLRRVIGLKRSV